MGVKGSKYVGNLTHCTLWKADRSPACRAVMMALDAMNLSISEIDVDMDRGEHRNPDMVVMNPLGTLPIFKDRELILRDSHAITIYLASRYCRDRRLLPEDAGARALLDQLMHYDSGVLYPRYKAAAYPIIFEQCRFVMPAQMSDIHCAYDELEGMLCGRAWLGGSWPTLGDIAVAATLSTLDVLVPVNATRYPCLSSWLYRMSEEMFYVTANQKGLCEFSKRIECGCDIDDKVLKCPRTSMRRRSTAGNITNDQKTK